MIVYILTNEAMPGLIKIGRTVDLTDRLRSLDSSGVPLPFQCYYAARVTDSVLVERKLHEAFGDFRVRAKREFFRLDPFRAKAALEIGAIEDVTPREDVVADADDLRSLEDAERKSPRFKFSLANVPMNSILTFAKDEAVSAIVVSDTKVNFEGREHSLTSAATIALQRLGYNWRAVQGPQYWLYEGETLVERRKQFEEIADLIG